MDKQRSLVLVTVDCLRADHVGFLGYDRPTTPFLDSLAVESLVLANAIVAGAPTYYSFPAIMASRYPLALGRDVIGLAPGEPTIASVLKESGYAIAAFLAGNPYLSRRFGYHGRFDVFRDFLDAELDPLSKDSNGRPRLRTRLNHSVAKVFRKLGPIGTLYNELYFQYCQRVAVSPARSLDALRRFPAADVIVDQTRAWLAGVAQGPFFLWLHFMDPHSPYYPPEKALDWMGHGKLSASRARYVNSYWNRGDLGPDRLARHRDEIIALYDAGIRWMDAQIARLVDTLRHFHLWENCVFALTADHGEEFLDHGGRYHPPSRVTEELVRVPLLLHAPGLGKREPVKSVFSLLDLAPTLLEAVNAGVPGSLRGRSHWSKLQKRESWDGQAIIECISGCSNPFHLSDRLGSRILAIREARYKLVLDFGSSKDQLFDLETDPRELFPLPPDAERPIRRRLLERARQHLAESIQSRDSGHRLDARLRDLQLELAHSATRIPT
jgi:arylsulfatase A-like enzyme